ncbi:MAG: T9SS type B sorting domain-containing protein [Ferruginibacter sp.]
MIINKIAPEFLFFTLLFSLMMQHSFAQKEISNFHYSNTGISYNSGNPQTIPGIPTPNSEWSIATCSDSIGNVLFDFCYTNPTVGSFRNGLIYDKNYQVMPGSNLFGPHYYYGSTALVAPFPASNSKYYLFYQVSQAFSSSARWVLKYAVIDMALNGGLGNVVSADNAIDTTNADQLITPFTLVQQRGSDNFWVVTCKANSDTLYSRFISSSGVSNNKVISKAGTVWFTSVSNYVNLVTSPDGSMIAGARTGNSIIKNICQVFNFNAQTGKITDKVSTKIYGINELGSGYNTLDVLEFSPDNKLLYRLHSIYLNFNGRCADTYDNILEQYNLCYADSNSLSQYTYAKYFFCIPYQFYIPKVVLTKKMNISFHYGVPKYGNIDFPNHIGDSYNYSEVPLPAGLQSLETRQFYHAYVQKAIKNSIIYTGGCYPDSLHFSITRDTTARVDWDFGDPASGISNTASTVKAAHSFSAPGIYTVTAKIFNAANLLIDSVTEMVERKDPGKRLLYPLPPDTVLCEGSSLTIRPHCINGIFQWWEGYNGTVTQYDGIRDNFYVVNSSQTIYIKMIQNGCNGCEQTDSIRITFEPKPRVAFGRYGSLCTGDSIKLDATFPGASHLWSTADTASYIWVKNGGTYWVNSIINQTGCASSDTITITEYPAVQVTLPKDTILCQGETLILRPVIANATSHTWNGTNYNGDSLVVTQNGTYWVNAINTNGCQSSDTINVTFKPSPIFSLGNDTSICGGTFVDLAASPLQTNVNYLWSTNSTNAGISVVNPGAYWLKLISTINGCYWQDTINVNFKTLPNFTLGPDKSICEKDTVFLNATVAGASDYRWNTAAVTPVIKIFQSGIYWCDVNKDGCLYRDSVSIIVKPLPVVNLGNDVTLCESTTLLLDATNANSTYLWQDGSTAAVYLVKQKGKYYVTVNKAGCFATDSINVNYILYPSFTLGPDQLICNGRYITLNPGINNATYLWQDGSSLPTYTVSQPGLYYVTASNNCGSKRDSVFITGGVCELYIPSAFTPNADGKNDEFKSYFGENVTAYNLQIFSRYGKLVFETTDKNKGWDGTYKGVVQPQGMYVWIVNYEVNGKPYKQLLKGSVLLIR